MNPMPALGLVLVLAACTPIAVTDNVSAISDPTRPGSAAFTDGASVARGAAFTDAKCSGCHAVGRSGDSAMATAPRLRDLGQRYPVDELAEAFAEGVVTGHPAMPEFVLTQDENRDLIAYLKSIQAAVQDR